MSNYINDSQQRVLQIPFLLAGNELYGLSNAEIAKSMDKPHGMILRDLRNLKEAGVAEQIDETGNWRLTPHLVKVSFKLGQSLSRAKGKIEEMENRFTRTV